MYTVCRQFAFCYGHRLLRYQGKCANLHGHNATVRIHLAADELDSDGFVVDFSAIKTPIEKWLDTHWDHRMILCEADPLVPLLQAQNEPVFVMAVNPTAENLAKHLFAVVRELGFHIVRVEFWETPNSFAVVDVDTTRCVIP